ncbi:SLBB domain-containing protein [Sphingobacterium chungjuense]|uniref:SLBB domain-containing protein n=1 Tax=Sphingobacterium chungjuense TaxID=2675553 RepID=UPI00140A5481|nr:SLBB domain-containing protein [Sphingobacterium chungjuense]
MMERFILNSIAVFILVLGGFINQSLAQAVDYSKVKVETLSNTQVLQLMTRAEEEGLSQDEMFANLINQGMPENEISKLRTRVARIRRDQLGKDQLTLMVDPSEQGRKADNSGDLLNTSNGELVENEDAPPIFGSSLFRNGNIRFEPNLNMATPEDYIIGTGDQLLIDLTGDNEASYQLTVSPEGTIRVEYVGIVSVSGLTIQAARAKLRSQLAQTYTSIRSGRTQVNLNLGNIRSIKITLTGFVTQPGTYTLPSVATVFNALYAAGGPSDKGTFRNIQVIRNNRILGNIDAYDFLVNGIQSGNIRLEDQDVIHIPVYRNRVEFQGFINRPGFYEAKDGERFAELLEYTGGFTANAYTAKIRVFSTTDRDRRINDIYQADFSSYQPKNGDQYIVEEILDRYENRVQMEGAVFRPGFYQLDDGLTVKQLIQKADGIKEDAFMSRAYINRLNSDNTQRLISFDLKGLLDGTIEDISLRREDRVIISSIFDLREEYSVNIDGEVRKPGKFSFAEDMTLGNVIHMAGGLSDAANIERIEIARRIRKNVNQRDSVLSELLIVNFDNKEEALQSDFELKPFDIINIRTSTGYQYQKQIRIEGEVLYPGVYTLISREETISDIIQRAGGVTDIAYLEGSSLQRKISDSRIALDNSQSSVDADSAISEVLEDDAITKEKILASTPGSAARNTPLNFSSYVGIDLDKIISKPHSRHDLLMEDGDIIIVPRQLQTITVRGEVLNSNRIVYRKGRPLTYYINQAGGFTSRAHKSKTFVQYANGEVRSTIKGLGRIYPEVTPGAEIIVPQKPLKSPMSAQAVVGLSSAVISTLAILLSLLR